MSINAEVSRLTLELDRSGARPDFGWWMRVNRPKWRWDYPHHLVMQRELNAVTRGEEDRIIFTLPIRHGKSEHNTVSYPAYRLDRNREHRTLIVSHSERQALTFSRQIQRMVKQLGIPLVRDAAHEWHIAEGGGVTALGAGAGTASLNADLIVIDDPIGKREHAESQARREGLWDWLTNDILGRTTNTPVLFTMSRWHTEDVAGRLIDGRAGDHWRHIDLPGRALENDALGRQVGAPLWEELRGATWLDQKLVELGPYGFASLIQGRPRPREGGMFRWDWWVEVDDVPRVHRYIRYWDTAGTQVSEQSADPDFTAGALLCEMSDGRACIVDVTRFRANVAQRDAMMVQVAREDLQRYGAHALQWWIETESGIGGRERTSTLIRTLQRQGLVCRADPRPSVQKTVRAEPLEARAGAGNVCLGPGEWRNDFRLEAADFPGGAHDDQVDAVCGALAKLASAVTVTTTRTRT